MRADNRSEFTMTTPASLPTVNRRVQQREIAERAGVSISTVSRVLNNTVGTSSELKQRVLSAALDLGYSGVVSTPSNALQYVSLFVNNLSLEPSLDIFHTGILAGVEAECRRQGMHLSYAVVEGGSRSSAFMLDKIRHTQVDGLILVSIDDRDLVEQVLVEGRPAVLINAEHSGLMIDSFLPDNENGPQGALRYLIEQGHRRIMHVTSLYRPTLRRRHYSYRVALEEAGIVYDPALVIDVPHGGVGSSTEEWAQQMLQRLGADVTAIFCMNDSMAFAVIQALQAAGRHVPDDVSVVGFDDIPMAALASPPLTTVRIEREELGVRAVRGLLNRAAYPHQTAACMALAARLIERQSVARIQR